MGNNAPITAALRQAIRHGGVSLKGLERATGVQRASLSRFLARRQSLRLDVADKLAVYFKLELRPVRNKGAHCG